MDLHHHVRIRVPGAPNTYDSVHFVKLLQSKRIADVPTATPSNTVRKFAAFDKSSIVGEINLRFAEFIDD
jgi:hypothetical protein